jgi:hypothetical protein
VKITVMLHCEGFEQPCSSSISTGLRDRTGHVTQDTAQGSLEATTGLLLQSASNSHWDIRPIATSDGETVQARCPDCTRRLLTWTAHTVQAALDNAAAPPVPQDAHDSGYPAAQDDNPERALALAAQDAQDARWTEQDHINAVMDILALVNITVSPRTVEAWTTDQRNLAEEWAGLLHLKASDNNVTVPPKPEFLG